MMGDPGVVEDARNALAASFLGMLQLALALAGDNEEIEQKVQEAYEKIHKYINEHTPIRFSEVANTIANILEILEREGKL